MRWRGWLGGFVPRLLPHSLSSLVLFLLRRLPLPAFVEPLILFPLRRFSLRALIPHGCGAQGLWWLSLWGSSAELRLFLSCGLPRVSLGFVSFSLRSSKSCPCLSLEFEPNANGHRELPRRGLSHLFRTATGQRCGATSCSATKTCDHGNRMRGVSVCIPLHLHRFAHINNHQILSNFQRASVRRFGTTDQIFNGNGTNQYNVRIDC